MTGSALKQRCDAAITIAREAAAIASAHFEKIGDLVIEKKGVQDLVSNADREVETFIRAQLASSFPEDGLVGEEFPTKTGTSGFTWVIDPIDGTANFVNAIPVWMVALACVHEDQTKIAVLHDAIHAETFWAIKGDGAWLNETRLSVAQTTGLDDGSIAVGLSNRQNLQPTCAFLSDLVSRGGIFVRYATGCVALAYVAAGRLTGYFEHRMHAWDCLAGQLLVAEAGGCVEKQSADQMIAQGGRVIAGAPGVFTDLVAMADRHFDDHF